MKMAFTMFDDNANGRPMDNNAFIYLNLAGLVKKPITVNTIDVTPESDAG